MRNCYLIPTLQNSAARLVVFVLMILVWSIVSESPAKAYTPEDPVVQKMIQRGIAWLGEKERGQTEGEDVLLAYAHFKVEHDDQHPLVKKGLASAKNIAKDAVAGKEGSLHVNYEMSMAVLLLAAVSPTQYRAELEVLQRRLFANQGSNGAFHYKSDSATKKGDISQTQYGLLAIWTLDRAGIKMDYNRVSDSLKWLLRAQDPGGCWPYQAQDPGPGKGLKAQAKLSTSMALAGGSSVLIAGDALRLWGDTSADDDPGIDGLPKAIKLYKEDKNRDLRKKIKIPKEPVFRSLKAMEGWRQKNPYKKATTLDWYYYQLYTLERYESFVEIANGRPKDKSPAWYNRGVDELRKYQSAEGGWTERSHSQPAVSTAFAILFLIRSTQKAIFTMGEGGTHGGWGFGDDVSKTKLVGGKAVEEKAAVAVTDMLDLLEGDGADELDGRSLPENLQLPTDPAARAAQMDRLERLVRGSQSWQARRVAARVLGKSDEMRVVPSLIFALSDPDSSVKRYARDGLRFISRKFEGYGMPDKPNQTEVRDAQKAWKKWFLTMDPGHVFLE